MISFDATKAEALVILEIAERWQRMARQYGHDRDKLHVIMDVTAVHANGTPLRLDDLLAADDFNFMHDLAGIENYLDRDTGQLTGCFLPRFSKPQSEAA